jgi:hypothetical protein
MNRDRDRIYGTVVTRRLRTMGIRDNAHLLPVPRHGNRNRVLVGEQQFKISVSCSRAPSARQRRRVPCAYEASDECSGTVDPARILNNYSWRSD